MEPGSTPRAGVDRSIRGLFLAVALIVCSRAYAQESVHSLGPIETVFGQVRFLSDQIYVTQGRPADVNLHGLTVDELTRQYRSARKNLERLLAGSDPRGLSPEDRRAIATIRTVFKDELGEDPREKTLADRTQGADCTYDASALGRGPGGVEALTERLATCFAKAAENLTFDGQTIDKHTVFARLPHEQSQAERRRLFLALEPIFRSVNADNAPSSPYRTLVRLRVSSWKGSSPVEAKLEEFGTTTKRMEEWLVSILERWRDLAPDRQLEPWDYHFEISPAVRSLGKHLGLNRFMKLNSQLFGQLGADPARAGIHFDLDPRAGKDPVAWTAFAARNHASGRGWEGAEIWVVTSYAAGGLDNFQELVHETGHAIHLAGIRTRPAFVEWPDSDTFCEALADIPALEVYEPGWQARFLGFAAGLGDSMKAKYGSIVMDVAWALFELKMHRNPGADPNRVWTDLTHEYLRIVPHPELSWWALRGQLIDGPGYMVSYAVGAIVAADLRARVRQLRKKPLPEEDATWYPWLVERLYRHGLARPVRTVLEEFLGRPVSPVALLEDLGRIRAR